MFFRCRHRQQLRSLLQKYSKTESLFLVNTTHAAVISEFRHIVSLGVASENLTDCEQLENLVSLTQLQSLSIANCVSGGAEHFPWAHFSALTLLELGEIQCSPDSQCKLPGTLQVLHLLDLLGDDCLQDLPLLTELHIDAGYVLPEAIAPLTRLTNLVVALDTPDERASSDGATKAFNDAMFSTIATLLNLRVLLVKINPSNFQVQILSALTNLTELEFDSLGGKPQCSLMAVQHLCCMSNLKQLNNLHFCSHPHYYQAASSPHYTVPQGSADMTIVSPASALRVAITDITGMYTRNRSVPLNG